MIKKLLAGVSALAVMLLPLHGVASAAALANPIANPQAATSELDPNSNRIEPTNWDFSTWSDITGAGAPVATPQYITNDGHDDSSSMKVTMTDYDTTYVANADGDGTGGALTGDDGDAKWIFDPLTVGAGANQLQAGKQYAFSMWYKTNLIGAFTPKVVVDYMDAAGNESFYGMSNPEPTADAATNWNHYQNTFYVPATAAKVTVFMFIDHNGWIQTDDYSLDSYTPTGFKQPLLTLTFDDGQEDNVTNALPLIKQYGLNTTQCFETQTLLNEPAQFKTNVMAFANAGQEICSHTITHPMLTQINDTQLTKELTESKAYLEQNLKANGANQTVVSDFASPYGDYNAHVNDAIRAAGYASHRTVDEGFNSKDNYDPYRLRVQNIFNTTTAAEVSAWIKQAQADNTWLILVYHRVASTAKDAGQYDTDKALFKTHLDAIKASGITVENFHDALAETEGQLGSTSKIGDITGDGKVNNDDATLMFANWGTVPGGATNMPSDLDHNGVINNDDATLLFANWSK
jgi:peptidoglycan/xylan/chitin deacetylase (PgdA/CDA1 family)